MADTKTDDTKTPDTKAPDAPEQTDEAPKASPKRKGKKDEDVERGTPQDRPGHNNEYVAGGEVPVAAPGTEGLPRD